MKNCIAFSSPRHSRTYAGQRSIFRHPVIVPVVGLGCGNYVFTLLSPSHHQIMREENFARDTPLPESRSSPSIIPFCHKNLYLSSLLTGVLIGTLFQQVYQVLGPFWGLLFRLVFRTKVLRALSTRQISCRCSLINKEGESCRLVITHRSQNPLEKAMRRMEKSFEGSCCGSGS